VEPRPDNCLGFAIANMEPHRPGKYDLFVKCSNVKQFVAAMQPWYLSPKDWPALLPAARK